VRAEARTRGTDGTVEARHAGGGLVPRRQITYIRGMHHQRFCWTITLFLAACGGAKPQPDSGEGSAKVSPERKALTQTACEAQSGQVIGDIGDGATHRPDYLCPSGKPPLGNIAAPEGGPIAIEGSVCCPR
jgi:hypothetical protein